MLPISSPRSSQLPSEDTDTELAGSRLALVS